MKRILKKVIPLTLTVSMLLGLIPAYAAYEDFQDVQDHWAEATMHKAYDDGILVGLDETTMAPDSSITTAQAVAVLCRVLHVTGTGDTSALEIPAAAWYAQDAAKGVYAGLLDESDAGTLDQPIPRGKAFQLFGRAFQVVPADPDLSVLEKFPDTVYLTGEVQKAAAALIGAGVVNGKDGLLAPEDPLTRAEFATILYQLADTYTTAEAFDGSDDSAVLSGDASFTGLDAGDLWFDHTASTISFTDSDAQQVVVRSDKLASFTVDGTGTMEKLVLAANSGDTVLDLPETYELDTLTVGDGTGAVTFSGSVDKVEITGSGRAVTVSSDFDTLTVSGHNNTITLEGDCAPEDILITGKGNTLELQNDADTLILAGRDNIINGEVQIADVTLNTQYYELNAEAEDVTEWEDFDLEGVEVSLTAPEHLAAGETLQATAQITVPREHKGKLCVGSWYLNNQLMAQEPVLLGKDTPVSDFVPNYTHDLVQNGTVKFVLSYTNSDGDEYTQEDSAPIYLDTYADLGLADTVITVIAPETLAAGNTLHVIANVDSPEPGKVCKITWYVDGKQASTGDYTLGGGVAFLSYDYTYYYKMPKTSTVKLTVAYTTEDGREQEVSGEALVNIENFADTGIAGASAAIEAPYTLEAGVPLEASVQLKYLEAGKVCTGEWYVDDVKVKTETVVLGTDTPTLTHSYTYTEDMDTLSNLKFLLSYTTEDGREQQIAATRQVTLENYDFFHYHNMTEQDVLNAVTDRYAGNYTLQWALDNDYDPELKTAWVNLKGYRSDTEYLIWVNLTYQRVNIFQGSQGNWELIRECLCGSGAPGSPTIRGVFTTSYKQPYWNYGSYYCGPVVRFYGSSGYAFHSRKEYWPMNSDRYIDARIGFPISLGCLRMYNDDIWFMYDNIPNGTTVVVH